jgi:hypothetical protein
VPLYLALRHAPRVERDDLLVEPVEAGLPFLDELWLELRRAVTRHVDLHLPALAAHSFRCGAVAGVDRVVAGSVVLLVAEVMRQLSVEGAFDERFSELLEQSVLTKQVIGLLVILEQFVEQSGRIGGIIKSPFETEWLIIATYTES